MGQIRADEGVVPGSSQSRGQGADVGRSQADEGALTGRRRVGA